jgi:hypothetical protein
MSKRRQVVKDLSSFVLQIFEKILKNQSFLQNHSDENYNKKRTEKTEEF